MCLLVYLHKHEVTVLMTSFLLRIRNEIQTDWTSIWSVPVTDEHTGRKSPVHLCSLHTRKSLRAGESTQALQCTCSTSTYARCIFASNEHNLWFRLCASDVQVLQIDSLHSWTSLLWPVVLVWHFAALYWQSQCLSSHSGIQRRRKGEKEGRESNNAKRTDQMKNSMQTRVVTNRQFYELQTWNGVAHVQRLLSARWQQGRVRASALVLCKNGLIHFLHERVSLGRHHTSQSTQIYGPLKQQGSWPLCLRWLTAKTQCALIHALHHRVDSSLFIPSSLHFYCQNMNSSHTLLSNYYSFLQHSF